MKETRLLLVDWERPLPREWLRERDLDRALRPPLDGCCECWEVGAVGGSR